MLMCLNPLCVIHSFSNLLVKTFGYHWAVHIEDAIANSVSFLMGTIVLSLILARSALRTDIMPNADKCKSQIIVVDENSEQVIYRKRPKSHKEAFWQVISMAWIGLHPRYRGRYFYRRSKFLAVIYWSASFVGFIYLLIITFFNVDVVVEP